MAPDVAKQLAIDGLDPDFLGDIAGFSALDSRDVLDTKTVVDRAYGSALAPGRWCVFQPIVDGISG